MINTSIQQEDGIILYIEDDHNNRIEGERALSRKKYTNIVAPRTLAECENLLKANNLKGAIIDFSLANWVGVANNHPLNIDNGIECHNGVEIAKYLLSKNYNIHIGLFSSFEEELKKKIDNFKIGSKVEFISQKNVDPRNVYDFLPQFVEKFYNFKAQIKPLFESNNNKLTPEIKSFYNKKLLLTHNMGNYFWRAGSFRWIAGVNKEISEVASNYETTDKNNSETLITKYNLIFDKESLILNEIIDLDNNESLKISDLQLGSDAFGNDISHSRNKSLFELYIVKYLCKLYCDNIINIRDVMHLLLPFSTSAKLESQKILFTLLQEKYESIKTREELYSHLSIFVDNGFPMILDIYKCLYDSKNENKAYIKIQSQGPEKLTKGEVFNRQFLENYNVEENAKFEYTIYKPNEGGSAYHIEPM